MQTTENINKNQCTAGSPATPMLGMAEVRCNNELGPMKYAESHNGLVHLISPVQSEYTLCGDAFDIDSEDDCRDAAWVERRNGPVTCDLCAKIIAACRGVRTAV